jgi:hypothetical protein
MRLIVAITTWPTHPCRVDYLRRTLESLKKNLTAGDREIKILVSSESERRGQWSGWQMSAMCDELEAPLTWHSGKANLGAHLNSLFNLIPDDIWFYCQDDYELVRPLNLGPGIELLESDPSVAMIRYYTIYATFRGTGQWREVDQTDRFGNWSYGDNPFLAHSRWLRVCGRYVEGGDCGVHETTMISQIRDSGLRILVPAGMDRPNEMPEANYYFHHIGSPVVGGVSAFEEKR